MANDDIAVEVVLALPDRAHRISLTLPVGSTVAEAVARSGLGRLVQAPSSLSGNVGRWGKACAPGDLLAAGDRVELYRPLTVDPMVARRRRAERKRRG
jgi:hypothetical protein